MWIRHIITSFFLCGISDTTWKIAGEIARTNVNSYLLFFHIFAFLSALITLKVSGKKIKKNELIIGIIIGFTLIAGGICSLKAIIVLPGIVFFPVASCSSLLLVTILASIFWKEKPTTRQIFGLIIACTAIILIAIG